MYERDGRRQTRMHAQSNEKQAVVPAFAKNAKNNEPINHSPVRAQCEEKGEEKKKQISNTGK